MDEPYAINKHSVHFYEKMAELDELERTAQEDSGAYFKESFRISPYPPPAPTTHFSLSVVRTEFLWTQHSGFYERGLGFD